MSGSSTGIIATAKSAAHRVLRARHAVRQSLLTPLTALKRVMRRRAWLFDNLTAWKIANLALSLVEYSLRAKRLSSMPFVVKIDISPLCSLRCPICLHADSTNQEKLLLKAQTFQKTDKMSVADFSAVIDQVKGHAAAVSLYYYGDPFMHPNLDELCGIARKAGLNVHLSSHFSYNLSQARLEQFAACGATHLTVAVDGASQEIYAVTRVRGRLDWVLSNLQRLCAHKRSHGLTYPIVEVQYIGHPHHRPDEEERVRKIVRECGADHFTRIPYNINQNVVDEDPEEQSIGPSRRQELFPRCTLPYTNTLIKHNGDVIPCCNHRAGRQYANLGGEAIVGNVFKQPLREIWNNKSYQDMRRFVTNPTLVDRDTSLKESFCYGCHVLTERTPKTLVATSA